MAAGGRSRERKDGHLAATFFTSPAGFRTWLVRHHRSATALWVGFHKKGTGRPTLTWPESVDEALCFGWIDGIRRSVDQDRYAIRFTPRKRGSTWSLVNVRRAAQLIAEQRMQPAGLAAYEAREASKTGVYSFEQRQAPALDAASEKRFRANAEAWRWFESQPPGYRRLAFFWVVSAKREETRARRLDTLIADSAAKRRIGPLRRER